MVAGFGFLHGYFLCALVYYLQSVLALDFWFGNMTVLVLFFIPILTMNVMSTDRAIGMDRLRASIGIPFWAVLGAKYATYWLIYLGMLAFSFPGVWILTHWGMGASDRWISGYLMLILLGSALLALGTSVGVWVGRGIGTVFITLCLGVFFWLLEGISTAFPPLISAWIRQFGFQMHSQALLQTWNWQDGFFFIWISGVFIGIAWWVGQSRYDHMWMVRLGKLVLGVLVGSFFWWSGDYLGWNFQVHSRFEMPLSAYTKQTLGQIHHPVHIYVYEANSTAETQQLQALLKGIHRQNPQIQIRFVSQATLRPYLSVVGMNRRMDIPLDQLFMILENPTRQFFRGEAVLNRALLYVLGKPMASIGWVVGHGEIDLKANAPDGGSYLAEALFQEPYQVSVIHLDRDPTQDIVVVAGPVQPFSASEIKVLQKAKMKGKHLLLLGDARSSGVLAPLLSEWGVRLVSASVVEALESSFMRQDYVMPQVLDPLSRLPQDRPVMIFPAPVESNRMDSFLPVMMSSSASWANGDNETLQGPFWFGILEKPSGPTGRLSVFGSREWVTNSGWFIQGNAHQFLNTLAMLMNRLPTTRPRIEGLEKLSLTGSQFSVFTVWVVLGGPGLCLIVAGLLWWRRRKL
jgi:ABC-2 type transport system permease protein